MQDDTRQEAHRSPRLNVGVGPLPTGHEKADLLPCVAEQSQPPEIWRPIAGLAGLYEVSDLGRVRSSRRSGTPGKVLRPAPGGRNHQYQRVALCQAGRYRWHKVHRLVAEAFLERPEAGCDVVCHRNDQGHDNRAVNLYWGTREDNDADRGLRESWLPADDEPAPF